MTDLVDKLQTQLFQLHSLHVKLESLLESVLKARPSPQLSIHVLESRRHPVSKSLRVRVCIRIASEGRRFTTKEIVAEKGQTAFSWLETFSFPIEALDGDVRLYVIEKTPGTESIQGTSSVRLSKLLDQDRHDFWCVVEKAEVRVAIRLVHSPEICYKHALQQVKTKIAKTEMLLLSCTIDNEKVDEGIERLERELDLTACREVCGGELTVLGAKVYLARKQLGEVRLRKALLSKAAEVILHRVDSIVERKKTAAGVILRAYRRFKAVKRMVQKAKSKFFDIHSSESVSFEEEKEDFWKEESEGESIGERGESGEKDGEEKPLIIVTNKEERDESEPEEQSSNGSNSESDEEGANYIDSSTASRFSRFRATRK